jgi:hypothetical protein
MMTTEKSTVKPESYPASPQSPLRQSRPGGIHIVPVPAQRLDDPRDGLLDGLHEHQLPVHDKLFWYLVGILEAEDIGLGIF